MSGAEGVAGLALGAVSVAALFTTCIQCFDIVVAGKDFSEDYEQLCALFSLQRARFGLWGESVGLIQSPHDGRKLQYNKNLDRPDIRPGIERTLNNIKSLLDEAGQVDDRYGNRSPTSGYDLRTSRDLNVFRTSFERFKANIKSHQKKTSVWKVTRWAIYDADKFEVLIGRLKDFVDGLESITKSLGLLEEQHARLRQEIESISDTESLQLLRDASSRHGSSHQDVSDTASRRLLTVAESIHETTTSHGGSTRSFFTARSELSAVANSLILQHYVPGSWPESGNPSARHPSRRPLMRIDWFNSVVTGKQHNCTGISCPDCLLSKSNVGPIELIPASVADFTLDMATSPGTDNIAGIDTNAPMSHTSTTYHPRMSLELPQNQRLLSDLLANYKPRKIQSLAAGNSEHGKKLASFKAEDERSWNKDSVKYLTQASSGSSVAKKMFFELRHIKEGRVPFVTATPAGDSLTKVLASIEGPPETPFEGGIFWITVNFPDENPHTPPLMRFQTKIYHPNISPQGHICADYKEKWNDVLSENRLGSPVNDPQGLWYQPKKRNAQWTLGALLTAICGLLASPDVNDPLVPEIAQKYIEDYDGYVRNARLYTQRFATAIRPSSDQLVFLENTDLRKLASSSGSASPLLTMSESSNCNPRAALADTMKTTLHGGLLSARVSAIPNPLIKHLPGPLIYSSLGKETWKTGPYDLSALLHMTRHEMRNLTVLAAGELELSFAMLEKAADLLAFSDTAIASDLYTYYDQVRKCSAAYICSQVEARSIRVSYEFPRLFKFTFDASFKHKEPWSFVRTATKVQDVFFAIADYVKDSQLSDIQLWCFVRRGSFRTCLVYYQLIQYGLCRALKMNAAKLLVKPAVLEFLRPRSFDDQLKQDECGAKEMDLKTPCIWCRNQEFRSLFPPSVRLGSKASITGPVTGPIDNLSPLDMIVGLGYANEGPDIHLVLFIDFLDKPQRSNYRELHRIESIDAVTKQDSSDVNRHCLKIRYTLPEKKKLKVNLSFENSNVARTWFQTLDLFRGILSSREECLRRSSVKVQGPHLSPFFKLARRVPDSGHRELGLS